MEQELDTRKQLINLIANPGHSSGSDVAILQDFAARYPYFQLLHLLKARATAGQHTDGEELATAALYTNGQLLHQILHSPEQLQAKTFRLTAYESHPVPADEPEALEEAGIAEVLPGQEPADPADEEIFDEIGEINFNDYRAEAYKNLIEEYQEAAPEEETLQLTHETLDEEFETFKPVENEIDEIESLEEDLVLENIVSTDFFAFQDNFKVEDVLDTPPSDDGRLNEESDQKPEAQVISKYDDDRLPYTFLWWLAKTRKEHQQIFQPYASPKRMAATETKQAVPDRGPAELQQQYVENIFHIQSVFGEEKEDYTPVNFKRNSKGHEIIDSFIKNEPQISPPKADQINNENKARKSAEDHSELVSETLAKIYIEQMLYDKAIETYEKLSLMFPEKSRYFADLVQSIEKKI